MLEAVPDRAVFKGTDPQSLKGLSASGFLIDQTEYQLTLTPSIRRAHKLGDTLVLHESRQHFELLHFVLRDFIQPFLRYNGQIVVSPFGVPLVIHRRIGKADQMADAPRNEIGFTLQIAVFSAGCAENLADGLRNTGFFCDH